MFLKHLWMKTKKMSGDQRIAYHKIMKKINKNNGGIIFLDAPGGTGKTFLLNLIIAEVRSTNNIALAMASSEIAATLLEGGRTAHSTLKLPMNIHKEYQPICNVSKDSELSKILKRCKIIAWDEIPMAHKSGLDHTLQDLKENEALMGNTFVLLAGDFRQTLPVIPRSTPANELNASVKASHLWQFVETITLTKNMRAATFSEQLIALGEDKIPKEKNTNEISFPETFCRKVNSVQSLIRAVFPDMNKNYNNIDWLFERAILAPTNEEVNKLNNQIQMKIPGECIKYKSIDSVIDEDQVTNYPLEFLNSLHSAGMPPHELILKVGSSIMLLRNLQPPKLCNGTRMSIKTLHKNLIEAIILNCVFKGEAVLIPRIPMISTNLTIEFKRIQFPVKLAFGKTINKSQGQTLKVVGLNLEKPCFSYGQLYVACSRVGSPKNLIIYCPK